jgi:hypothetical protein
MKTLIALQLRKNLMGFAGILLAMLASIPLPLIFPAGSIEPEMAIKSVLGFWALIGMPLAALLFACSGGSEAARGKAAAAEQAIPVSQYRVLISYLIAALLQLAALALLVYACLNFTQPLGALTPAQKWMLNFFIFSLLYLALAGFTCSYIFRNGIVGALSAAAAVFLTVTPLIGMSVSTSMNFAVLPMPVVIAATVVLALGGTLFALKLLSALSDRKEKKTLANISAAAFLLTAPPLTALLCLAIFNSALQQLTLPFSNWDFGRIRYQYLPGSEPQKKAARLLLAQRPFTGETFLLDETGRKTVIIPGSGPGKPRLFSFLPDLDYRNSTGQAVTGADGESWLLISRNGREKIFSGTPESGFKLRAEVNNARHSTLVEGKRPGLIARRGDGTYYCDLPPVGGKLQWVKKPRVSDYRITMEKYYKDGAAARFSSDRRSLIYGDKRWQLPYFKGFEYYMSSAPVPGFYLKDGINFLVVAGEKAESTTYLCRPDGTVRPLWSRFFAFPFNVTVAPDGTVWNKLDNPGRITRSGFITKTLLNSPSFYIQHREGKSFERRFDGILLKTGVKDGNIRLAHSDGDALWLIVGNKYLAKTGIHDPNRIALWRLPETPQFSYRLFSHSFPMVHPAPEGIFVMAFKGVYFMDWEGRIKKIL